MHDADLHIRDWRSVDGATIHALCLDDPTRQYCLGESVKSHFKMLSLEHDIEHRLSRSGTQVHQAHQNMELLHDVSQDMQHAILHLENETTSLTASVYREPRQSRRLEEERENLNLAESRLVRSHEAQVANLCKNSYALRWWLLQSPMSCKSAVT